MRSTNTYPETGIEHGNTSLKADGNLAAGLQRFHFETSQIHLADIQSKAFTVGVRIP